MPSTGYIVSKLIIINSDEGDGMVKKYAADRREAEDRIINRAGGQMATAEDMVVMDSSSLQADLTLITTFFLLCFYSHSKWCILIQ